MKDEFNFRHLMDRAGIPMTNENNWRVGQMLQAFAKRQGIDPERRLSPKTNPNPSVAAPHCIAHYPIHLLEPAMDYISDVFTDDGRQTSFDFEP